MEYLIFALWAAMVIAATLALRKAVKLSKKIEELLSESEAYAYAKKYVEAKKEREKLTKEKRAQMILELEKREVKDDGQPV